MLATTFFVAMNTTVKYLRATLPTIELIWARSLGHLVFVVLLFAPAYGGWRLLVTRRPAIQFTRSLLLLSSTSFFFFALAHVPLAEATAVSFTSPFVVAALAGRALGERVGPWHWVTIALGFVGALIVTRPGAPGGNPWVLLVFGSSACYGLYQILTRRVAGIDRPETSVTYSALVGTIVLTVLVPYVWRTPARLSEWLLMGALGILGGLGHYCVARAFTLGPASIISPIHYVQLIGAAAAGYLVFGDVPGAWTWVGATVIVASGLAIAWRETRR